MVQLLVENVESKISQQLKMADFIKTGVDLLNSHVMR